MRLGATTFAAAALLISSAAAAQPFSYLPPGDLAPGSGQGREDYEVYAPGMRFPIEVAPAYVNSQVWGHGGSQGPGGSQCDVENYSYPWRDNYCEARSWTMPLCPAGTGHQGNDIRPSTCDIDTHWAVAAVDGTITNIGSYSVYLTADDGTRYDYLHMSTVQVSVSDEVSRGDRLGLVSNQFGGTPTTIHLHFNLRQFVDGVGDVYVPSYMSLVESYYALTNQPPEGALVEADCEGLHGWAMDPDAPDAPLDVMLAFDGELGDPSAIELLAIADLRRETPCDPPTSCEHGFELLTPLSIFDGTPHDVFAYGLDAELPLDAELAGSPLELTCDLPTLEGWLRQVDTTAMSGWAFSPAQDLALVDASVLAELPRSSALVPEPLLVTDEEGGELWVMDGGLKRAVADERVARAWRLDIEAAEPRSPSELAAQPTGPPLRVRPVLLSTDGATTFLLDEDVRRSTGGGGGEPLGPGGIPGDNDGCSCRQAPPPAGLGWLGAMFGAPALAMVRRRARPRRCSTQAPR